MTIYLRVTQKEEQENSRARARCKGARDAFSFLRAPASFPGGIFPCPALISPEQLPLPEREKDM